MLDSDTGTSPQKKETKIKCLTRKKRNEKIKKITRTSPHFLESLPRKKVIVELL